MRRGNTWSKESFQQTVLEQMDIHMQKMNQDTDLKPFTEMNSKSVTDLNVKHRIINLLEDNIGESLYDIDLIVTCYISRKP